MTDNDDGIYLAICNRPQLQVAPKPYNCKGCGGPILGLGDWCRECLLKEAWKQTMAEQAKLLRENSSRPLELAVDLWGNRHVGLIGRPRQTFCGTVELRGVTRRTRYPANRLPAAICEPCAAALKEVLENASSAAL
jgi:hypothetical protein